VTEQNDNPLQTKQFVPTTAEVRLGTKQAKLKSMKVLYFY